MEGRLDYRLKECLDKCMDMLVIEQIKLTTLVGVHPWEQTQPQALYLDLKLQVDAHAIAKTDCLKHTIDYDSVLSHIHTFVQRHHFQLIETLAEKLANEILVCFPTPLVQLHLYKPRACKDAKVSLHLTRSKSHVS